MRFPCLLTLGLLGLLAPAAAAQDPVQLGRLASEQRLVAEQVRRLAKLLETLEQRDRAEGREARADLLAQAGARLKNVDQGAELASVIESIAGDLTALRTGNALSAQNDAIQVLEQLLEMLQETQVAAEQEQRLVDLQQHIQELEDLRQKQEQLRQQNEALMTDAAKAARAKELEQLAAQQRQLAEEMAKLGADRRSPKAAEAAEHAKEAAESLDQAASTPGAPPQPGEPKPASAEMVKELEKLAEQQRQLAEKMAQLGSEGSIPKAAEAAEDAQAAAEKLDQAAGKPAAPPQAGGQKPGEPKPGDPKPGEPKPASAELAKQLEELARQERKLADEMAKLSAEGASPQAAAAAQEAQKAADKLDQAAGKPAAPQQQKAAQQQKEAEKSLQDAIDQAKQELKQLENRKRMQELEDVRVLAEQILTAHRAEEDSLKELAETRAESLTRAQRARLRQSARTEQDLSAATKTLLVKIETLGASTFPFFLHSIEVDHQRLATEIGPPRLAADEHALQIARDLTLNWETLIEAIRTEQERIRRKMEDPGGEAQPGDQPSPEEQDNPLVDFATELQLLKRMQTSLARDLDWTRKKFESYARAGLAPDPGEELQLQPLLERQIELRRQFEDMLARMQEGAPSATEDL